MNEEFTRSNTPVSEQAAAWFFELEECPADMTTRVAFIEWLKRSPQHIEAFLAIAVLEQELSELPSDMQKVLASVESMSGRGAVPINEGADAADKSTRHRKSAISWQRYRWVIAASIAATSLSFMLFQLPDAEPPAVVHKTDFGEQRSIALRDGSIVTLNTRSELGVRFDESARRVELISGEAMFDVVRNGDRPFVVESGDISLKVLGTKFSVYRQSDSVRVAVVDGVVRAVSRQMPDEQILVSAGDGAVVTPDGTIRRNEHIDLEKALAWTDRRLIFDSVRLADVVHEFNRYNRVPLVVDDARLADRRITSVFNANDVSALVGFLELEPDVEVDYGADAVRIRVKN